MDKMNKKKYTPFIIFFVFVVILFTYNDIANASTKKSATVKVKYYSSINTKKPIKTQTVKKGTNPKEIKYTKSGYAFKGWYTNKACTKKWDASKGKVKKDTVLYAKMVRTVRTINYYSLTESKDKIKVQNVKKGSNPSEYRYGLDGYEFNGWYTDKECKKSWDEKNGILNKDINLYAKCTKITKDKTVYVTPSSRIVGKYLNTYTTINNYSKNYYMLRSYMEAFEKNGGGKIVLKAGTYTISNAIYVPSNVTITLEKGVVIKKVNSTGTTKFAPSKTIFTLIKPSLGRKGSNVPAESKLKEYNGVKNVTIIGKGSSKASSYKDRATIDLDNIKGNIAITSGHCQNINIQNIKFQNVNVSHFIEMDATKNAKIIDNYFYNAKKNEALTNKEAINLDTPDVNTQGFNYAWTSHDKTPNRDILIQNNKFYKLDRALGTHKYSEGKYHQNIRVLDNTISSTREDAIRVMNWKDSEISNNTISNVGWDARAGYEQTYSSSDRTKLRGILLSGTSNFKIKNNTFSEVDRSIQYIPWKNPNAGSGYAMTHNKVTSEEKEMLKTNKIKGKFLESFVRITPYGETDATKGQEKIPITVVN